MDANEVTEVCRLCPSSGDGQNLINVFDKEVSFKYNLKEVIFLTTGIEVQEHDLISKKLCQRCCKILLKMYEFRLDAIKQDRALKERLSQYLKDKGIQFPNTSITIKRESRSPIKAEQKEAVEVKPSISKEDFKKRFHPSIIDIYKKYPHLKLPKRCFERHMTPIVSLTMNEVESYFKKRKLNMKSFIYNPNRQTKAAHEVAKNETSTPENQKTVAPLKISKKLFENYRKPSTSSDKSSDISVSVSKKHKLRRIVTSSDNDTSDASTDSKLSRNSQARKRKRAISSTDSEETAELKLKQKRIKTSTTSDTDKQSSNNSNKFKTKINRPIFSSDSEPVAEMPMPTACTPEQVKTTPPIVDVSASAYYTSEQLKTPSVEVNMLNKDSNLLTVKSPSLHSPISENIRSPSPGPDNPICEDSCSSNISEATTSSSISKPEFIDSLGLTPAVTATKSHTLLMCSLCGSVHQTAYELKMHTKQHMVCQFCKRRFKSVKAKQDHVDNSCQVKIIMNSPEPSVALEKIDLNLKVRKKYKNAFATFDLIPELMEPSPLEHVVLAAAASPLGNDDIIVLSDDDNEPVKLIDPLSGIPTPSSGTENLVYNTVSIVRPDIRIKNNIVLNNLVENLTDKQLLKDLITIFRPQPSVIEKMIQTDLPATKDIKINYSEGTCDFKKLKHYMETYKIPITMSNGSFHVAYQFREDSKANKPMQNWNGLSVIDVSRKSNSNESTNNNSVNSPLVSNTSKLPLPKLNKAAASAVPGSTATFVIPPTSAVINSPNLASVNILNSATPLLQNYALSVTPAPAINKPIPIPRTYVNSALSNTAVTLNRAPSLTNGNNLVSSPPVLIASSYSSPQSVPNLNFNQISNISSTSSQPANLVYIPAASLQSQTSTAVKNVYSVTTGNLLNNSFIPPSSQQQLANTSVANINPVSTTSNLVSYPYNPASQQQLANTSLANINPVLPTSNNSLGTTSQQPVANTNVSSVSTAGNFPTSQPTPNPSLSTSATTSSSSEPVRFRVKNVWELQ